jgi:D-alanyl-D-alanine dipeptidase
MSETKEQMNFDEVYLYNKAKQTNPNNKIIISIILISLILITLLVVILVACLKDKPRYFYRRNFVSIPPEMDFSDFVIINDIIPEIVTELRYYSSFNFAGVHIDGYEEPVALMTKEAVEKLKNVSKYFDEKGYRIKIWDSYRPQRAVDHFVRWGQNESDDLMKPYFYPDLTKKQVFDGGYIAKHSGHSKGSTIDMTLLHKINGTDVDFGSGFDFFGSKANFNYTNVTDEQKENRIMLNRIMTENGFNALPEEWWHFTLKNEPFPNTYFNFPINATIIRLGINNYNFTSM